MGTKLIRGAILATATAGGALAAAGPVHVGGAPDGWKPDQPSVEPGYNRPLIDEACIPVQPGVTVLGPAEVPYLTPGGSPGVLPSL
ncbi:hypothetical protein ACWDUD_17685 [Rhodococcus sp. NPDC003382]